MARLSQDVSAVELDDRNFDPVPPGTYRAQIIESDVTQITNGEMLKLTFVLLDPPYENRRVWDNLCIVHSNPTTQTIAQQRLKAICDAIGHSGNVDDSEELHEQPMMIRIAIDQKDANYAPKNAVKGVRAVDAATPAGKPAAQPNPSTARSTQNGGSTATKPAPTAATGTKPWQRGRQNAAA